MCWIVWAIWKNLNKKTEYINIKNMLSFLYHRWPDFQWIKNSKNVIFWTTRLAIMDLSHNWDMPFDYNNWEVILTYNWEITNFLELKKEYKLDKKYNFKSNSDTEVLLYLYIELWIRKLLKIIDWYFSFSIFDKKLNKVYIVRDFFWTRPLFYLEYNKNLYFSSEIKSLLQIKWFKRKINKEAIYHYFWLWYIPWELTSFKWIKELDWGHFIEYYLDNWNYRIKEYYKIDIKINKKRSFKETKNKLFNLFKDSIKRNFNSDVKIGSTLSWWIDTSIIVWMLKKLWYSKKLHTFAIKVNESSFDESKYQKIMSKYADTIHHKVEINAKDVRDNIYKYIAFTDEPYADGSAIPTYILSKYAKKYVKVLLSWEWWDELFSAYETHQAYLYRKIYNKFIPKIFRKIIYKFIHKLPIDLKKLSFDFKAKRFISWIELNIPESHYYWRHILSSKEQKELFWVDFWKTSSFFSKIFNKLNFKEDLQKIAFIDMKMFLIWDLMIKNDRMTMANSIEWRFPFLEKKLTEFAFSIPETFKINLFNRRIIEKESFKSIMPKRIYKRSNFWMEIPYSKWLINDLKDLSDKYFTKEKIEESWILNYKIAKKLIDEHFFLKLDNWRFLWALLNFLIWYELFIKTDNYRKYVKEEI